MMKTLIYSTQEFERPWFEKLNDGTHDLHFTATALNPKTAHLAKGYEAVCVFVHDDVGAGTLQVLRTCGVGLVALRGAGYNNIDIKFAHALTIKVVRVPAYSPQAIAEHAVALILALSRKTHKAYNRTRENNFSLESLMGFNLYGKTVGVIGMGRIGAAFTAIMKGFGCRVVAYDPLVKQDSGNAAEYMTFEGVLRAADVISIHCPLTPDTKYLFDKAAFGLMKHGAMLINTARGGVLNTAEAIAALKSGRLGSLGIDVYEQEGGLFMKDLSDEVVQDDILERLMAFGNVLVTPHQAFFTQEAVEEIVATSLANIAAFRDGAVLINEV